jgi:hypothetical protein
VVPFFTVVSEVMMHHPKAPSIMLIRKVLQSVNDLVVISVNGLVIKR